MKPTLRILFIVIVALCVCSGVVLAQDHLGDGPPVGQEHYRAPLPGTVKAYAGGRAVSFRTDTGPELDFYQPCSGGDNLIDFAVNVHGVDLASAQNGRLTMAMWDIDYDCGGACSGNCERDTVYVNGHQLTTPMPYLTGADSQWSTVSFDVPISFLVNGDNKIEIFVDTLGNGCWCATCDWAELTMDADCAPEIGEIEVVKSHLWGLYYTALPYPVTGEEFYLRAKITEVTGYVVEKVNWGGAVSPGEGNPYAVTLATGDYGKKTVTAMLTYKKTGTGEETTTAPKSKEIKVFFPKKEDDDGDGELNWFEYWMADGAVPDMAGFVFAPTVGWYGWWNRGGNSLLEVGPLAAEEHYTAEVNGTTTGYIVAGGRSFGGAKGIDCAAEVAAHERYHKLITDNNAGLWAGLASTDSDGLIDDYETNTSGTLIDDPDTYNLAVVKNPVYAPIGDQEFMAMVTGEGKLGVVGKDWAYPGKQAPGAIVAAAAIGPVRVLSAKTPGRRAMAATTALTGVYTDQGTDTNANSLYDYLAVSVGVDVEKDYLYSIVGLIEDGAGLQVGVVTDLIYLTAGAHTCELDFDGVRIHELGSDGPYRLSVILGEPDGAEYDNKPQVYTTAAYTISQFEGAQAYFGPGITELAKDNDLDGSYDQLDLTVTVNVTIAGMYDVSGFLTAPSGATICHLKKTSALVVGANSVVLTAPGNLIRQSRADGPYTLSQLGISDSTRRIDHKLSAYTTQAYAYVSFAGGEAEIGATTSFTDAGIDLDGDVAYDVLRLTVPVTVTRDGTYAVTAGLFDDSGGLICDAYTQRALVAGANSVVLDFSGEKIHVAEKDGPYLVKYVSLYDASGTVYDRLPLPYTTAAYTVGQFDVPDVALTGQYDDRSIDTNSDGIYESLEIDVAVLVASAGTYAMNARLMDRNGGEITWASTTATLLAGNPPKIMHLSFDGPKIYTHGINGPYFLRDVYFYNKDNAAQFDRAFSPYTTKAMWRVVPNQAPVANAGDDQTAMSDSADGTTVTLDGSRSTDPDSYPEPNDDIVLYQWLEGGAVIATGMQAQVTLPIGVHSLSLRVTDSLGLTSEDTMVATVPFATPPAVAFTSPTSDPTCLLNWAELNIAGTCTPGATLAWSLDTGGGGMCTGGTSWTAGPLTLFAGANVITVTATDIINRTGYAILTATFDDTVAPVANAGDDQVVMSDSVDGATVGLDASASTDPNSTTGTNDDIVLYQWLEGATVIATGMRPQVALPIGVHTLTLRVTDTLGLTSDSTVVVTVPYATPPVVAFTFPTSDPTSLRTWADLNIEGTCTPGATLTWSSDRGGGGACRGTTTWSGGPLTLVAGANVITVMATDIINRTGSATLTATFDATVAPVANAGGDQTVMSNSVDGTTVSLDGSASTDANSSTGTNDDIVLFQWLEGATVIATGALADVTLPIGIHTLTLRVTDLLGHTAEDTVVITVPFVSPPVVALTSPTTGATYMRNSSRLSIAGTCTPGATLTWSCNTGGGGIPAGGATWTVGPLTLVAGANVITVTATDIIHRTGSATLTATFDSTAVPGAAWGGTAIVSLPVIPDQADPKPEVGFSGNNWHAYSVSAGYIPYGDHGSWFQPASATPGRAFWASFPAGGSTAIPYGTIPPQNQPVSIHLLEGWNLVGSPFIRPVTWDLSAITVQETGHAIRALKDAGSAVCDYMWGWDSSKSSYYMVYDTSVVSTATGTMDPWLGYWIKAKKACDLIIPAP